LLLGTVGLTAVMLRGLFERRGELALLSAIGFRHAQRLGLVLAENGALLIVGLIAGAGCALVGVLPVAFAEDKPLHLGATIVTLAVVSLSGLSILTLAIWWGGRKIQPADLRRE